MGTDGHDPQPAETVQGNAGNGLRGLLAIAGTWWIHSLNSQLLFQATRSLAMGDALLGHRGGAPAAAIAAAR